MAHFFSGLAAVLCLDDALLLWFLCLVLIWLWSDETPVVVELRCWYLDWFTHEVIFLLLIAAIVFIKVILCDQLKLIVISEIIDVDYLYGILHASTIIIWWRNEVSESMISVILCWLYGIHLEPIVVLLRFIILVETLSLQKDNLLRVILLLGV